MLREKNPQKNKSSCVNHKVYQYLSSGRSAKMTNKTSGTRSAAVTGAWQEMLESLTPSEGWGASSLIRTSCHLWRPPRQTLGVGGVVSSASRRGLAPAGRVTWALWLLPRLCSPRVCEGLGDRPEPPWLSAWISLLWENGQPREPRVDKWVHNGPRPLGGIDLESDSGCDWYCLVETSDMPGSKCEQVSWKHRLGDVAVYGRTPAFRLLCCCFFNFLSIRHPKYSMRSSIFPNLMFGCSSLFL